MIATDGAKYTRSKSARPRYVFPLLFIIYKPDIWF